MIELVDTTEAWLASLHPAIAVGVVTTVALLVAHAIRVGGDALLRPVTRRIEGEVDDVLLRTLHPAVYGTVLLGGAYLLAEPLGLAVGVDFAWRATVLALLVLVWTISLVRLGRRLSKVLTSGDAEDAVVPIFQNIWTAIVVAVAVYLLLWLYRVDVTPLLASAGILGIVLGFAARDAIANFFGSVALFFDGTYKVGDYVVLESGERGRVEDISIRSTVLRTRDDVLVTVPNSVLNNARITNESAPSRDYRIRVGLGVAYGTDLDRAEASLLEVAADNSLVLDDPSPRVRFRGFGDSAVDTELLCWVADPVLRGRVTHQLVKAIHTAFAAEGIEIPFPQRDVHVARDDGRAGSETRVSGEATVDADD